MLFAGGIYQELNRPEYIPTDFSGGTSAQPIYYQLRNISSSHLINGGFRQHRDRNQEKTTVIMRMNGTPGIISAPLLDFYFSNWLISQVNTNCHIN